MYFLNIQSPMSGRHDLIIAGVTTRMLVLEKQLEEALARWHLLISLA